MQGFRARSRPVRLGAIVALFGGLGGAAYAAGSSSFLAANGTITSCLPPNGGVPHFWKPGHRCSGGWVALDFSAAGATGPSGATGATGATGQANPDATTVDGQSVSKLLLREPTPDSGTTTATLYAADGLTILADCDSSGNASLVANGPASDDSELTVTGYGPSGAYGSQTSTLGAASDAVLGPAGSGAASVSYASSSGSVITGTIGYQKADSFNNYAGCAFFGDLTAG